MLETTKELEELSDEVNTTASPERLQANAQTISDLVASGLSASALREGDVAPDFALPDTHGHVLALKTLLDRGPVVISFYRGGWCPFCNLELRGLQHVLPEIVQVGASLVAISPQLPDNSLSTEEKNQLTFPVLSDVGNIVAKDFGIVFTLPVALVHANKAIGRDLVEINGEAGAAQLPMPATFVLDTGGVIRLAFVEEDWSKRLDPDIVVDTLRGLGKMTNDGVHKMINKAKLRAMILQLETLSIAESRDLYQSHLDTARLDLSEPNDQGQRSQQEQSAVEAQAFEDQSHLHQKHRNVIEALPLGRTAVVQPGAVVNVNNRYFVIAVPTQMISIDGIDIIGISIESPLYEAMAGLGAGETFEFRQKTFVVTDVQ
jgi:peroxiredoxin/transcription elongation GreA/GreB family factor